jgi:hypothetical protein
MLAFGIIFVFVVGVAVGYGIREVISRRRHVRARHSFFPE